MTEQRRGVHPPVIDRQLAEKLSQYRGRWVAVDEGRVVADGESALEVLTHARALSVPDPLVFRVPLHPRRRAFYGMQSDAVV